MLASLQGWRLRRPFSRKIRVDAAAIAAGYGAAGHGAAGHGPIPGAPHGPLETAVRILSLIYAGDYSACDALLDRIEAAGQGRAYAALIAKTDLRKLCVSCFGAFLHGGGHLSADAASRLLRFSHLIDPEAERVFRNARDRVAGQELPQMTAFDYAAAIPKKLKVMLFFRTHYSGRQSRLHDVGVRIYDALAEQGLDCRIVDAEAESFEFERCDLAIVDDASIFQKQPRKRLEFRERLRPYATRMATIEFDPWADRFHDRVASAEGRYDFMWTMAPLKMSGGKIEGTQACIIPFPVGAESWFADLPAVQATDAGIKFCGAVEHYNFHRYFWILAGFAFRQPFEFDVTGHQRDDLSVEQSIKRYLAKLAARRSCLNFTMRSDGTTIMVGRSFDVLCAERLLVQNFTPDMHAYFTPDQHYLEFASVDELERLCAALREPGAFETVRKAGAAFFRERYSNQAIVRHLMTFL